MRRLSFHKMIAILSFVTLSACISVAASAETITYAQHGGWSAFGGTTHDGTKVCGIFATGGGRYFTMKYFKGQTTLTVQLANKKWRVDNGDEIPVKITIDEENPWSVNATAFHFPDGDGGLEFSVNIKSLKQWLREFSDGNALFVEFPDNNVDGWKVSLEGTTEIIASFARCMNLIM